ncbi:hypothetical protein JCM1840_000973 [Sporobolomyces johnsonii]
MSHSSRSPVHLVTLAAAAASVASATPLAKRLTELDGYYNPTDNGGRWLTLAQNTYPAGLGEPINVVISANSDGLLMTDDGFFDYAESLQFSGECLGQTGGDRQAADLGDGNGMHNQTTLLRFNYGDPTIGTCYETINGGSHFRVWRQNGTEANSGAWFLAASVEQNLTLQHGIVADGYDRGREVVVQAAIASGGTKSPLTNRTFTTTVSNASGPGYYANISTSEINHDIATDGIVAILTVKVTSNGSVSSSSKSSSAIPNLSLSRTDALRVVGVGLFSLFALGLLA